MSNIWFTSDTHYHHKNIVKGVTSWVDSPEHAGGSHSTQNTRPFKTLEEHDQALVDNINKHVKPEDILYHLGDWSFGGIEQIWNFRKQLNCKNIHLIYGNHDHHIERNAPLPNVHMASDPTGQIVMKDGPVPEKVQGYDRMSIYPAPARKLFASAGHYKFAKIGGQSMVLCHFAMRVWDKAHHGTWMLYGHSHGTLPKYSAVKGFATKASELYRTMDVGVDTHPEFRPYHFDEIAKIMEGRPALNVDHHNKNTN